MEAFELQRSALVEQELNSLAAVLLDIGHELQVCLLAHIYSYIYTFHMLNFNVYVCLLSFASVSFCRSAQSIHPDVGASSLALVNAAPAPATRRLGLPLNGRFQLLLRRTRRAVLCATRPTC